jgi:predicted DNA-binding protein (MmcQ/YjbR family)
MAAREPRPVKPDVAAALRLLRPICLALPDAEETASFGNPAFKAKGKAFAVLDRYKDKSCLWLLVDPARRDELLALPGWFKSPYDPRERAMCCELCHVDWELAAALIGESHGLSISKG